MLSRRPTRLVLIALLIVIGLGLIAYKLTRDEAAAQATPMDIEWVGDYAFASIAEGRIARLTVDGDRIEIETVADGLQFPRGLAVIGDTLYVAELGALPCENPVPRCKGENVGPTIAEGERRILAESAGRVLAFPIEESGLGEPTVLVDGLHFVNADHGLNDLEVGPDGFLYLSIGNLDRLAWDDGGDPPDGPETELIGTITRIDPSTGTVEAFATGLRNVFGLAFDDDGVLWGVDNDGHGRGPWRFEELLRLEEGLDYGFPDDGTAGPYARRTGFPTWIMRHGAGSGGLVVRGTTVISGGCGTITRVNLVSDSGDAVARDVQHPGCTTAIAEMPDGRLLLGTVFGDETFAVTSEEELFAP